MRGVPGCACQGRRPHPANSSSPATLAACINRRRLTWCPQDSAAILSPQSGDAGRQYTPSDFGPLSPAWQLAARSLAKLGPTKLYCRCNWTPVEGTIWRRVCEVRSLPRVAREQPRQVEGELGVGDDRVG